MTEKRKAALGRRPGEVTHTVNDRVEELVVPASGSSSCSPLARVLRRLEDCTGYPSSQQGNGWAGRCPAHDDTNPSLSITEGDDGRVLLHCFANCTTENVVAALGLKLRDLFPRGTAPGEPGSPPPANPPQTFDEFCMERHLNRKLLEARWGVKETEEGRAGAGMRPCLRYPTSEGVDRLKFLDGSRPKYLWAGKGAHAHWYGLEQAHAHGGDTLYIVNGEPSVWAADQEGIPAVALCGECGVPKEGLLNKISSAGFATFRVVYDRDPAGRIGASKLVPLLRNRNLDAVALDLPERLGEGGDVDDLHRLCGDRLAAELLSLPELTLDPEHPKEQSSSSSKVIEKILLLRRDSTSDDLAEALRQYAECHSKLDPITRCSVHAKATQHLRSLGFSSAARGLEPLASSVSCSVGVTPTSSLFPEPDPWPEEVDGLALANDLLRLLERYVVFDAGGADACSLWVLFAHTVQAFDVSPLLAVVSPTMECGKSTLLTLLGRLVPRPLPLSSASLASIFRIIESDRPTLVLDEVDASTIYSNQELRGILNAGHTRSNAWVLRTVGDDYRPKKFSVWSPKVLALIGKLPGTLHDRSIVVSMRRRRPEEVVQRIRIDRLEVETEPIRRRAARWAADHVGELREADPEIPDAIQRDRARDNWRPLLAIAEVISPFMTARAHSAAVTMNSLRAELVTRNVELLMSIRTVLSENGVIHRISSEELLRVLLQMEDHPWAEYRNAAPLTKTQLAGLLRTFNITPGKWRQGDETVRGYYLRDFEDAFSRYLSAPRAASEAVFDASGPASPATVATVATPADLTDQVRVASGLPALECEPPAQLDAAAPPAVPHGPDHSSSKSASRETVPVVRVRSSRSLHPPAISSKTFGRPS